MSDDFIPQCPNECASMHIKYENNGFDPSEGAPHYEAVEYYCPVCGRTMSFEEAEKLEKESEQDE